MAPRHASLAPAERLRVFEAGVTLPVERARAALRMLAAIKNGDLDQVAQLAERGNDAADFKMWWEDICITAAEDALDEAVAGLAKQREAARWAPPRTRR